MTMELILLGIMAAALLFSFGRNAFAGLGLKPWAAFLVLAAWAVGLIVPTIRFGGGFRVSVGGFILPIIIMFVLLWRVVKSGYTLRAVAGMLAVVAVTTSLLLVMPTSGFWLSMLTIWTIGIVTGALAFIVSGGRISSVFAAIGGVAVGDLIYCLIAYFAYDTSVVLGGTTACNAMLLSVLLSLVLSEIAWIMGKDPGGVRSGRNLGYEAGKDNDTDRFDDELFRK